MSKKNYFYKVNPSEVLAEVLTAPNKEAWFIRFFNDLRLGCHASADSELAKSIILEASEFRSRMSKAGKNGAEKKHSQAIAKLSQAKPNASQAKPIAIAIAKAEKDYSPEFLQFWEAYPKKVNKGSAFDVWVKINPPLLMVLKAIAWQKKTKKWLEGFILDPERYIKKRGWEDEPDISLQEERPIF